MTGPVVSTHLANSTNIGTSAFIAPGAVLVGDITIGEESSVWYQCVLRADIQKIAIGKGSNIQDGTIIHLASDIGTTVGDYVSVGHRVLLHACEVEDECLIGMGAIVMDGAKVGTGSLVAAGSLVTKGMEVPPGSLVMGSPARVVRSLSEKEKADIRKLAEKYIRVSAEHHQFLEGRNS